MALAAIFAFVRNQGDAWNVMLDALALDFDAMAMSPAGQGSRPTADFAHPLDLGGILGRRTAETARRLRDADRATAPSRPSRSPTATWRAGPRPQPADVTRALDVVAKAAPSLTGEAKADAAALHKARKAILARALEPRRNLAGSGLKTRIHGDYHLGQVLVAQDDVFMIDFEGEPQRGLPSGATRPRRSATWPGCSAPSTTPPGRRSTGCANGPARSTPPFATGPSPGATAPHAISPRPTWPRAKRRGLPAGREAHRKRSSTCS